MGKLGYSACSGLTIFPEKTINITYATPRETVLGTPETLASSEPTTANASFTVLSSDLPIFDVTPTGVKYTGTLLVGGKNTSASSKTVNYSVSKNGTVVRTGSSSVAAGYYYCLDAYNFYDINVNDVIEAKVWCDSTVDLRYKAFFIQPTRLQIENISKHTLITDINYVFNNNQFSTGNTTNYNTFTCYIPTGNDLYATKSESAGLLTGRGYIPIGIHDKIKGLFIVEGGDYAQTSSIIAQSSSLPYKYNRNIFPIQINYKPTNYTFD